VYVLLGVVAVAGLLRGVFDPLALLSFAPARSGRLAGVAGAGQGRAHRRSWPVRAGRVRAGSAPDARFHNPQLLSELRLTPDAAPMSLYLNFDKPLAGFWLLPVLAAVACVMARAMATAPVPVAASLAAGLIGAAARRGACA